MKKICKDCNELKDSSEYYGVQGECKSCTKERVRLREQVLSRNPDWLLKEKKRNRNKYHRLGYKDIHKPTPEMKTKAMNKHRNLYPEKYKAKNASQRVAKKDNKNHNHHWSYNKEHWKDVIELTVAEHNKLHRFIIYDQERMMYRRIDNNMLLDTKESHLSYFEEVKLKEN